MFAIVLCKMYPKSSISLYPHHYYTSPSHRHAWVSHFYSLPTNLLSHKTADQSTSLLCLKPSHDLFSMAFRMMFLDYDVPYHLASSPLISSPAKFLVHCPFSSLSCQPHSCFRPLTSCSLHSRLFFPLDHAWLNSSCPQVLAEAFHASDYLLCSCLF